MNYEMGYSPESGFEGIHEPSLLDFHGCSSEAGMVRCYPVSSMETIYLWNPRILKFLFYFVTFTELCSI